MVARRVLHELSAALERGEIVAVPTDTVYGLAADATIAASAERLFELKRRPMSVALPVLVASPAEALRLAAPVARARLEILSARYWPGALTIVVERDPDVAVHLGGDPGTVGIRCPGHPLVRELCAAVGPLAVTSANRHLEPSCRSADEVRAVFGADVAVLDGGRCDGMPSSVVSLLGGDTRMLREGPVALADVLQALQAPPAAR